jgi:hypothetical protein
MRHGFAEGLGPRSSAYQVSLSRAVPQLLPVGRPTGSYPETGFEEINSDVPEDDFWPGITSGYPVTRARSQKV